MFDYDHNFLYFKINTHILNQYPIQFIEELPLLKMLANISGHPRIYRDMKYGKRYLPVPLAQLFTLILFFYWLNLCAVSLADQ